MSADKPFRVGDKAYASLEAAVADAALDAGGDTAAVALAAHEADTTNIHGIANTAVLVTTAETNAAAGTPSRRTLGTGATQAAAGDHAHAGVYEASGTVATHAAAADPHTGYVLESLLDAKGDLIAASADNTPAKVTVGADETVLVADSTQTAGVKWASSGLRTFTKPAVWNIHPNSTTGTFAANQFRGCFITVPVKMAVSKARIRVAVQAGNISVGVYNAAGNSLLFTTGAIACPAVGLADVTFTAAGTLEPGVYFIGASADGTSASLASNSTAQVFGAAVTASAHPAPASVSVDDNTAGSVPVIGLF